MKIKQDINNLLQKDMDRRDFLKHVGIGFAAIVGLSAALKTLSGMSGDKRQDIGYGTGAYGGSTDKAAAAPRSVQAPTKVQG